MHPDEYTISEQHVDVDGGHRLYVQEWGSKSATKQFVFLHGGPGSGCNDSHKGLFDPLTDRVLFFDQRGSGLSTPAGSIKNNTTQNCIDDIELLTTKLKFDEFYVVGSSWGCLLAFCYAIAHPKRVKGLVLGGVFTGTQEEIDFLDKGMFRKFFPEAWATFEASVPHRFRADPAAYHAAKVIEGSPDEIKQSAYAYGLLESSVLRLDDRVPSVSLEDFEPGAARIELYYMANHCFLPEGYVRQHAKELTMPIWMVQGRYDMLCPPQTAHQLHKLLPNSKLLMTVAGHSGSDRANFDARKAIIAAL